LFLIFFVVTSYYLFILPLVIFLLSRDAVCKKHGTWLLILAVGTRRCLSTCTSITLMYKQVKIQLFLSQVAPLF